jgi:hypothetical protein
VSVLVLIVPSTTRLPFAEILPAVVIVTPVSPYPPPTLRESNEATPAPVMLQWGSTRERSEVVALPMVIVPAYDPCSYVGCG